MHCNLYCNNIFLTTSLVAKFQDFEVLRLILPLLSDKLKLTQALRTDNFMPPEILASDPYSARLGLDVLSLGCVVCHVITQQWPTSPLL